MKGINQATMDDLITWATGRLLPKLVEFLNQEHNLQTSMKEDLESLERQLRTMDATLFKMSQSKQDQLDPHDRHYWAIDAWELSYDIEDTVDNILLCVEEGGLVPIANQDIFRETLEGIKVRVNNLSAWRVGDFVATRSTVGSYIKFAHKEVRQLVGIHKLTAELISMMSSAHGLKKVSIWGAGGMGKTTLAKAVYDNIKGEFHCSAFVSVGLRPDVKKVFRDILVGLGKERYTDFNMTRLDETQLKDELRHFLKNKRFLIIIDDIRDMPSWEQIECALTDSGCESRIITTSRKLDVAERCGEVLKLMPLSIDGSKELFYATLCGRKATVTFDALDEQLTEYIIHKCGGVPLAIITIASLLAGKPQEEWTQVCNYSTGFGNKDNIDLENTRKIMQLSYYGLPSHLKTCLLYLSIFPKDHAIEKDTLVWRWVAEGFVQEELGESLFKVGERYFYELINRSMIQPVENEDTDIRACRVPNMVHDLICIVAKEENFVTILDWYDHDQHLSYQSNTRIIAVQNRDLEKHDLTKICKPKVRSFNGSGCRISSMMSVLPSFQVLRVLCLEGCRRLTEDGSDDLKNLAGLLHLRYLGIRGMMSIRELPAEIGNLRFLQTLDFTGDMKALPHSVTQLRQLKCLRCFGSMLELPEGMGNLTSLEELQLGVTKAPNFAKELSKLTELRVLRIRAGFFGQCRETLMESLSKLQKIEEVELSFRESIFENKEHQELRRLVIAPGAFPKLWYLKINTWLMYQPGAMPCLKSVELDVHVKIDGFHCKISRIFVAQEQNHQNMIWSYLGH
ncbi:unnamed protein product [Urochloa decumbens]|uniref:Uncharacterized protein n=1 Tax=Urochloa decumbens TaxID=240449 RepID=A0ABC8YYK7_9POAL